MHSQCMKPLGLGVQGLLGMRRVGVEVAGAGETACLALRRLGLGTKRVAAENSFETAGGCWRWGADENNCWVPRRALALIGDRLVLVSIRLK